MSTRNIAKLKPRDKDRRLPEKTNAQCLVTESSLGIQAQLFRPIHTARTLAQSPTRALFAIRRTTPTQMEINGAGEFARKNRIADLLKFVSRNTLFFPAVAVSLCQTLEPPATANRQPARRIRKQ